MITTRNLILAASAAVVTLAMPLPGVARDNGQWETTDKKVREWYKALKRPDNPTYSCCGEADAYYADTVVTRDGKNYAVITDEQDDLRLGRPHIEKGTEYLIPDNKMTPKDGNPTGHKVIFIGSSGNVLCFVMDTGT